MTEEKKIEYLLQYLDTLSKLNGNDYKCKTEIKLTTDKIQEVLDIASQVPTIAGKANEIAINAHIEAGQAISVSNKILDNVAIIRKPVKLK